MRHLPSASYDGSCRSLRPSTGMWSFRQQRTLRHVPNLDSRQGTYGTAGIVLDIADPRRTGTLDGDGDEDCLFLNVFTPADAADLPVVVWIRKYNCVSTWELCGGRLIQPWIDGGGYGMGGAAMHDFSEQIYNNDNAYIAVVIQYRLGAFGFLSSAEVARSGVPNAGIHDIYAALVWAQKFIWRFGGDPTRVTISGMSAGAGAAMLLATANGGSDGAGLFQGIIAASPYLPTQW